MLDTEPIYSPGLLEFKLAGIKTPLSWQPGDRNLKSRLLDQNPAIAPCPAARHHRPPAPSALASSCSFQGSRALQPSMPHSYSCAEPARSRFGTARSQRQARAQTTGSWSRTGLCMTRLRSHRRPSSSARPQAVLPALRRIMPRPRTIQSGHTRLPILVRLVPQPRTMLFRAPQSGQAGRRQLLSTCAPAARTKTRRSAS